MSRQLVLQLGAEWLGAVAGMSPQLTQAGAAVFVNTI